MTTIAAYKAESEVASSSSSAPEVVVILVLVAFLPVVEREEVGVVVEARDQGGT